MPESLTQQGRTLRVTSALGEDVLVLHAFSGEEGVSRPFRFQLEVVADGAMMPQADALLGTPACVAVDLPGGGARHIHGLVSRFRRNGAAGVADSYHMELVPWLWMLSLSTDCRIFQAKAVPEIVKEVFDELGFADYRLALTRSYAPREFCVQYRETHLAFVTRLLEDEGILYYFEHAEDKHTLVLADNAASLPPSPLAAELAAPPSHAGLSYAQASYSSLAVERSVHIRKVALTDYNYLTPSTDLAAQDEADSGQGEAFDFPGNYLAPGDGTRYARLRLEEAEAARETATGRSNAAGLQAGHRTTLVGSGDDGGDREWLVLSVGHSARQGSFVAGDDTAGFSYENYFQAVPAQTSWRPARRAPRPRVRGTQSALVVGKAGEEIWTDAQGRVKLHFHWDRRSRKDENSSCWVRCSTAWAGKGWGQFSVPRIGQEVLVDFLEGNPDRPIVVGRVYNAEQPPPCNPGGGGVVSGMRSKTHKGDGYNAMEMDDTAGKEKISIHAQYDMETVVGHDQTDTVNNNRTTTIAVDDTESVGSNQKIDVGADQALSVGANQKIDVGSNRELSVGSNDKTSVGGDRDVAVGSNRTVSVGGNDDLSVGSDLGVDAGANIKVGAGANVEVTAGGNVKVSGTNVEISGAVKITMSASGSTIEIGPAGISIQAASLVNVQGATIKLN